MSQTLENGKKPNFLISNPILARLPQIWAPNFFSWILPTTSYKFFWAIILDNLKEI